MLELLTKDARKLIDANCQWTPEPPRFSERALKRITYHIELNLQLIARHGSLRIEQGRGEALLIFTLNDGRTQTVLLSLRSQSAVSVAELKSRCRLAQTAATIRAGLKHNLSSPWGGFSLDLSGQTAAIDLVYRLLVIDGEPDYSELIESISSLIYRADSIEQKYSNQDLF